MFAWCARVSVLVCLIASIACQPADQVPATGSDPGGTLRFSRITTGPVATDAASTGGVSWVDFDADGDLDLFVTNGYDVSAENAEPQKNRLYRNDGGGTFTPVKSGALAEDDGFSSGSTWGDFDNDGDIDAFVTNQRDQDNFLYRNAGGGTFERVQQGDPVTDGGHSYSASWVDLDNDGWLDLWVANGGLSHASANSLYRNSGDGAFARVEAGEIVTNTGRSGGAVWGDYDDDGDLDLFVPNLTYGPDPSDNALYRNDGDWNFVRVTEGLLVNDGMPSICAAWGDVDNDGDLDLYVGNLFGWTNLLYLNEGGGRFSQVTDGSAVADGGATYAVNWADADNDGDLDLLVVNWGAAPVLYLNEGQGSLVRASGGDLGAAIAYGANVAWGDYDADGDLDVYLGNWPNAPGPGEPNQLFRNDGAGGNWLDVRLSGTASNRTGIGARVTVRASIDGKNVTQVREVAAHTGWRSQNSLLQHFGLGDAAEVESIEVRWPSGTLDRLTAVDANQVIEIVEGETSA